MGRKKIAVGIEHGAAAFVKSAVVASATKAKLPTTAGQDGAAGQVFSAII